jgi:hypothetical protein
VRREASFSHAADADQRYEPPGAHQRRELTDLQLASNKAAQPM